MKIGDIATIKGGKRLPKGKSLIIQPTKHPYIKIKDMYQNRELEITSDFEYIDDETYEKISKYVVNEGNIIIAIVGNTIGLVSIIGKSLDGANLTENCVKLINLKGYEEKFLFYYLKSPIGQAQIHNGIVGSSQPKLPLYNIEKIEIPEISLNDQLKIVNILDSVDRKININKDINDNLLQQASAIYTDMFISNASPTWQIGHLSDLITVRYGKDHKKLADGIYPVYGSGGIMRYVERPIYDKESVLIPRKGTLNNVMYVNKPFWSVDTMFFTEMKLPNVAKFVFHFVKSKDLASLNAGSAVPSMTTDILNAMELPIPDADTLEKFENIVAPMYLTVQHNTQESSRLAELRDSLLPRLMSGELDVSNLDI